MQQRQNIPTFSPAVSRGITGCCVSNIRRHFRNSCFLGEELKGFHKILAVKINPLALRALPLSHLRWAEGEETWICHLHGRYFLTPPSCGHLPYILLCKTQRRRRLILSCVLCLLFSPAVSRSIAGSCVSNIRERPKKQLFRGEGLGIWQSYLISYRAGIFIKISLSFLIIPHKLSIGRP